MNVETYRGFVYPWEIDHVGHMNVQFYVRKFDEASWHFLFELGIGPSYLRESQRGVVALEQSIRYRREVLAGSLLVITTRLLEIAAKTVRYLHVMSDPESGETVAEMDLLVIQIDTEKRKSVSLPEDVVRRAREHLDADALADEKSSTKD